MSVKTVDQLFFGGVDSRSNPLSFPSTKSLRSINWVRTDGGWLRLRHGYTKPTMTGYASGVIHSAVEFPRRDGGKYILFSQGASLKQMNLSSGAVSAAYTFTSTDTWDSFLANNFLHMTNGVDPMVFSDSTTVRITGIRAPTSGETASITTAENTGTTGSWAATVKSGYRLYVSYYNPTSGGHVGNRSAVGSRITISGTQSSLVISNLPDLSTVNSEWVKLIGRTGDNGEVPYALINAAGDWITAGNTQTVLTLTASAVGYSSELPVRNTMPPLMAKVAYCQGRAWGIDALDPHKINYSEAEEDTIQGGGFVGRPEQAWPGNNSIFYATGEVAVGIHEYADAVLIHSRNHLSIYTDQGGYSEGRAAPTKRGTWPGGIAGQRAFIKTKYGPFWVSPEKQLMSFSESGPVVVSNEYEAGLLAQIGDQYLDDTELAYLVDAGKGIDRLYVRALNSSGEKFIVVHDFRHSNEGFNFTYTGLTIETFVRSPENFVSVRDTNERWRLWAGANDGRFYQLEDGDTDNGASYTGDYITMVNFGWNQPQLVGIEWQGDSRARVMAVPQFNLTITELDARQFPSAKIVDAQAMRYRVPVEKGAQYMLMRIKLDSDSTKGSVTQSAPFNIPVSPYGNIYVVRPELGLPRSVGGARP